MSRVLVVSNLYPPVVRGGYEVECRDAVEHLAGRHDVVVLTSTHRRRAAGPDPRVLRLLPFTDETPTGVLRAPWASRRGAAVARAVLARVRPDVVFLWNPAGLPHAVVRELCLARAPLAIRVCQEWTSGLYRDDLHLRYRRIGHHGRHAVWARVVDLLDRLPGTLPTDHPPAPVAVLWNSRHLERAAPPPPALDVVHSEVLPPVTADAAAFTVHAPAPPPPPGGPAELLVVARIEPLKGVDVAVRAAAELRDRYGVTVRLTVVGGGEPATRSALDALVRSTGTDVVFTGPLRGSALHTVVGRAHVWLVPSRAGESAPMVAVEAGLARVPLVAARVGGLPELLREPAEAVLFAPDDPVDCARAVHAVLTDPDRTRGRVVAAAARAADLGVEAYRGHLDRFLDHVLDRTLHVPTATDHREPTR